MSLLNLLDCCFFLGTYIDVQVLFMAIDVKKQALLKAMIP